jgi:hypothetical protein
LEPKVELFRCIHQKRFTFEGDLLREKTVKWMISGAFSQNNNAADSGPGVACLKQERFNRCFFDTMFKYNGWAASAAYMSRMTDNALP